MNFAEMKEYILSLFDREKLNPFPQEYGFSPYGKGEIHQVGYATNLSPEVIEKGAQAGVQLIITHHDAWAFLFGFRERCYQLLEEHGISHCFFHAPLDDADFGTNATLAERLGLTKLEKATRMEEAFDCGRIGMLPSPISLEELVQTLTDLLEEPIRAWKNHDRPLQRIGLVTGAGMMSDQIKEMVERRCDAYITGEKSLYTVEYAKFAGINLLVGSHTFTEIFGVEALARKLSEKFPEVRVIQLHEEHLE